jgi:hypothetical protein
MAPRPCRNASLVARLWEIPWGKTLANPVPRRVFSGWGDSGAR